MTATGLDNGNSTNDNSATCQSLLVYISRRHCVPCTLALKPTCLNCPDTFTVRFSHMRVRCCVCVWRIDGTDNGQRMSEHGSTSSMIGSDRILGGDSEGTVHTVHYSALTTTEYSICTDTCTHHLKNFPPRLSPAKCLARLTMTHVGRP